MYVLRKEEYEELEMILKLHTVFCLSLVDQHFQECSIRYRTILLKKNISGKMKKFLA